MKFTLYCTPIFFVIFAALFQSISSAQENQQPQNYDPTKQLQNLLKQAGQNKSDIWTQVSEGIKSIFGDKNINVGQNFTNGLLDATKSVTDAVASVSSFITNLRNGFSSLTVQPALGTGVAAIDVYLQSYLEAYGVQHSCYNDLKRMIAGVPTGTDWAVRMLDAFGKPGSDLKNYQLKWLGSYEECIAVKAGEYHLTAKGPELAEEYFSGKYCTVSILLEKGPLPIQPSIDIGTCMPSSCSSEDIKGLLRAVVVLATRNETAKGPNVSCQEKKTLDAPAIVAICILSVLGILIVLGTLYDIIAVQMNKSPSNQGQDVSPPAPAPFKNGFTNGGYVVEPEVSKVALNTSSYLGNTADIDTKDHIESNVDLDTQNHLASNGLKSVADAEVKVDDVKLHYITPTNVATDQPSRGKIEKALLSFSVYTNGVKILSTNQAAGSLGAVNGIRFLSMAWIILGHTYFFAIGYDENIFRYFGERINTWPFMGIISASVSVDTFFALSGLLVAYLTLKELKKAGGIRSFNWFMFYFHRVWRLTPAYMLILMVFTTLMRYWGSGPMWPTGDVPYDNCKTAWWTNLLYVNNFVHLEKSCIGWTWYLANDMQFYILSPLILIPLFYQIVVGGAVSLVFLAATIVSTAVIAVTHHYPVQRGEGAPQAGDDDFSKLLYVPCYARMGPYIIGLFTGYLLYRMKSKCRMPKVCVLLGWAVSLLICLTIIYSPYSEKGNHIFSNSESAAYHALHRTGWGIVICWIVFACATGHGGWINEVLSWKAFIPLGRLTYCAYLIHPIIMLNYNMSRRQLIYFNIYEVIYMFLPNLVMSYGVAFILSLAFESPMMGLEKALLKRDRRS